ncbi:MAG: O-acetyl-ADP-ribose deacetylase [Candidatus Brocadiaceae bacterium]|jgi:O-acetyl-ADP-ribose deacetylase (regulator of RNase III)
MKRQLEGTELELVQGDITRQKVDAIVNAANSGLGGGGGVDGAIHRAGGPSIMAECRRIGGCPTGSAVITTGGELPAEHVIHAVGPRWHGGNQGESDLLANAYLSSLELAVANDLASMAFPSISTGAYGYPVEQAARVALGAAVEFVREHPGELDLVRFVLFTEEDLQVYAEALAELLPD